MTEELRIRILNTLATAVRPGAPVPDMLVALRELDAVAADLSLPGDLRHYLSRRSYDKARLFLENSGPIPPGECGRGALY